MRVIELKAENLKKLSAITIRPDTGGLVQITGKNGNGKSSTLDALWWCIAGADHIQSQPIRKGADSALIRVELGTPGQPPELIATRTFAKKGDTEYTTSVKVESADGARFPKPQDVLNKLLGELAFDPLEFARLKPREQFDALMSFVPDIDLNAVQAAHDADMERRKDINRSAKEARAAAEQIPPLPEGTDEMVDVADLNAQLAGAAEHNTKLAQRKAKRNEVAADAARFRDDGNDKAERAQTLRAEADKLEADSAALLEKAEAESKRLAEAKPLPAEIDTAELLARITAARDTERLLQRNAERIVLAGRADKLEADAEALTAAMNKRNADAVAAVQAAKLPVEGIGFGAGEILIRGVPFDQASDAEKLKTSIAIAMAKNPKLRVLRIRDGSLLDEDSLQVLQTMLDDNDYQCWIEMVDSSGKVGFVLEDGHLKGAPSATTTPEAAKALPATAKKPPAKAAGAATKAPATPIPEPTTGNLLDGSDDDL